MALYPAEGERTLMLGYDGEEDALNASLSDGWIDHVEEHGLIVANYSQSFTISQTHPRTLGLPEDLELEGTYLSVPLRLKDGGERGPLLGEAE